MQPVPLYEVAPARAMRDFQVVHADRALGNFQIDSEYLTSDVVTLLEQLALKLEEEAATHAHESNVVPITPPPRVPQRATGDGGGLLWLMERGLAAARV